MVHMFCWGGDALRRCSSAAVCPPWLDFFCIQAMSYRFEYSTNLATGPPIVNRYVQQYPGPVWTSSPYKIESSREQGFLTLLFVKLQKEDYFAARLSHLVLFLSCEQWTRTSVTDACIYWIIQFSYISTCTIVCIICPHMKVVWPMKFSLDEGS